MKYLAIIQARMDSSRLSNKILLEVVNKPILQHVIERVQISKLIDEVIVVTSIEKSNLNVLTLCAKLGIRAFVGSEDDLLDRYYQAARLFKPNYIVRITSDCPLFDGKLLDEAIASMSSESDYLGMISESFADGLDIEIVKYSALKTAWIEAKLQSEREHVTQYILHNPERFSLQDFASPIGYFGHHRWTLDEEADYCLIKSIIEYFYINNNKEFGYLDILRYLDDHPELAKVNSMYSRNEGLAKSLANDFLVDTLVDLHVGKGQSLYNHAKKVIPGGTQLLSKRPEMFLPEYWPAYYSKAKGCEIWDLDGNHYYDMSYMGIGANTLGYANDEVDNYAIQAIKNGGMCTLNAPEEVELADKLLSLHKWAGGVRYAKTGGEGMAQAVRIARAFTQKDIVLFCGYHGWHDWYLSANITNPNALNDQHLAGLEPLGVPKGLYGTCRPFHYNNTQEFFELFSKYSGQIAAVVMEPIRNDYPKKEFMQAIIDCCHSERVVLIFDEITAGFRLCTGGSHLILGYEPDIAVFGKGMTNGYPLSAILGREEIMEAAQRSFISSTYNTERVAFVAALKAIEVYDREIVWKKQIEYGKSVKEGWKKSADKQGLSIDVGGIDPLAHFKFNYDNALALKTFFTQEMLKEGFLATNAFYASYAHSPEVIKRYLDVVDTVFGKIHGICTYCLPSDHFLDGPVCHSGFERLN